MIISYDQSNRANYVTFEKQTYRYWKILHEDYFEYSKGDTGPGGGTIFLTPDDTDGQGKYWEAVANTDSGQLFYGNPVNDLTSPNIGEGEANTTKILAAATTSNPAEGAQYARDFEQYGYTTDRVEGENFATCKGNCC